MSTTTTSQGGTSKAFADAACAAIAGAVVELRIQGAARETEHRAAMTELNALVASARELVAGLQNAAGASR